MPSVLLVRHAQASFGAADYDVLSPHGRRQVGALAGEIARRGVRPDRIVTGTHARQRDTAAPIAAASGLTIVLDERFNEYDSSDVPSHHSSFAAREERPATATPERSHPASSKPIWTERSRTGSPRARADQRPRRGPCSSRGPRRP